MKKLLFLLLLIAPCLLNSSSWSADRGIVPIAVKDKSGKQIGLYKESHALVIGVSEYTNGWPRLPGVVEDIQAVKAVLEAQGFNVVVVQNPNRRQIDDAFTSFINKYGKGKDNRLLFYFAGHGHTLKPTYGGDMGYIVPVDAPDPNRDEDGFREKAMDMQMIEVYARRIQSKHAVFIFDSCFSGSLFAMSRTIPEAIEMKTSRPVRQFITAGTAQQTVPDKSLFRSQFVRALNGEADLNTDGYVTASEMGQYLEDTVTNYSKKSQTPQYGKIRDPNLDQGDFVFPLRMAKALPDVEAERKKIEEERLKLAEESKTVDAQMKLNEEKKRLDEERQKLQKKREQMAKLEALKPVEKPSTAPAPTGMVKIPAGEFMAGLGGVSDNLPRKVKLNEFYIDKYEVTQEEFEKVMGNNPSHFKSDPLDPPPEGYKHIEMTFPVDNVTWNEAVEYCERVGKRLPTEWEWEKAAKGGSNSIYTWGNNVDLAGVYAWHAGNSGNTPHSVGEKKPNGYGLYDMAGNVSEWTSSTYDSDYLMIPPLPMGYEHYLPVNPEHIVTRGGSWFNSASGTRPADRDSTVPGIRSIAVGFRCVQ